MNIVKQLLQKTKLLTAALAVGVLVFGSPAFADDAPAVPATGGGGGTGVNVFNNCGGAAGSTDSGKQICGAKDDPDGLSKIIKNVINAILFLLGIIAVIMIIIGGIKYTTSNGDSNSIASAKNTILYAVIGLVVALTAYAIVNFVVAALTK